MQNAHTQGRTHARPCSLAAWRTGLGSLTSVRLLRKASPCTLARLAACGLMAPGRPCCGSCPKRPRPCGQDLGRQHSAGQEKHRHRLQDHRGGTAKSASARSYSAGSVAATLIVRESSLLRGPGGHLPAAVSAGQAPARPRGARAEGGQQRTYARGGWWTQTALPRRGSQGFLQLRGKTKPTCKPPPSPAARSSWKGDIALDAAHPLALRPGHFTNTY